METTRVSTPISQANSFPDQVLIESMVRRNRSVVIEWRPSVFSLCKTNSHPAAPDGWVVTDEASGLLRGGLGGRLAEVVVVGHLAVDHVVLLPLHRALRELLLRLDDFLEHGGVHLL